jgi:uncharacterized integral membrane protein
MAIFWVVIGLLLATLLWTFGAQNSQSVDLQYFGLYLRGASLWVVAIVPILLGLLLGFLTSLPGRIRGMMSSRRLRGQLAEHERTIAELRGRLAELERVTGPARPAPLPLVNEPVLPEVPDTSTTSTTARPR